MYTQMGSRKQSKFPDKTTSVTNTVWELVIDTYYIRTYKYSSKTVKILREKSQKVWSQQTMQSSSTKFTTLASRLKICYSLFAL